jgi:hypothetical protein
MLSAFNKIKYRGPKKITWMPRYSHTDEPDKFNRWARIMYNELGCQVAWINRVDGNGIIKFSANLYFPTKHSSDTPFAHEKFDDFEDARNFCETAWKEFKKLIREIE